MSKGIILIFEGEVSMYYKNNTKSLAVFQAGSYFGEISYLYKIRNHFRY
jgi:CRP-like cAMP-binding protein